MQYKPPPVRKKTRDDTAPANPPGASLVTRNTNFSATYSVDHDQSANKPLGRGNEKSIYCSQD